MDPETPEREDAPDTNTNDMLSALDAPLDEAPAVPEPEPAPSEDTPQRPVSPTPTPSSAAPAPGAPPSTPAPAPAGTASPEPAAVSTPDRNIPLAVLLDERRKSEERYAALQARVNELEKKPAAPADPEKPPPDFLEDPKGYIDHVDAKAQAALAKLQAGDAERTSADAAAAAEVQLSTALSAAEDAFTATTPDFREALGYARQARGVQLEVLNPSMPAAQIAHIIGTEERALAVSLARQGVNPAERIYQLSKSMGYTPKQAPAPAPLAAPALNGSGPAVVDPGLTLNSTPGTTASEVDDEEPDMLSQAQAERFSPRGRRN